MVQNHAALFHELSVVVSVVVQGYAVAVGAAPVKYTRSLLLSAITCHDVAMATVRPQGLHAAEVPKVMLFVEGTFGQVNMQWFKPVANMERISFIIQNMLC